MAMVVGLVGVAAVAAPAGAKGKAPVKLDGKVNNKGKATIKNGAVDIEADNFSFSKTFLKGSAGEVKVEVENESSVPHTFTIDDQEIDEELAPGEKATVTVSLEGDPVTFYCQFHVGQGMQGAFYTGSGGNAASTGSKTSGNKSTGNSSDPYGYG
jgi:plastocyanin